MTHNAFDDALEHDPALSQVEETLLYAAAPITPPPALRADLLARIEAEPQVASIRRRNRPFVQMFAAAATVVVLAGTGVWWLNSNNAPGPQPQTQASSPTTAAPTTKSNDEQMNELLAASDVRHGVGDMMGSEVHIAVSDTMGKGLLTVEHMPAMDEGMTAQVWAVMENGDMKSAGMLQQTPAAEAAMQLPPGTMKVMVTEEPMAGSPAPAGEVLTTVILT